MRGKPNGVQNLAAMKHGDVPAFVARLRVAPKCSGSFLTPSPPAEQATPI
jgi:hypothetical protein